MLALDGVDLTARPGEFVSILGPSGCGKSTLLLAIAGLLRLSGGTISVDGRTVTGPGLDRAVVFQEAGLLPWRSAAGNVALGLEAKGVPRAERAHIARRYLELVGLGDFLDAHPRQLSGGMKQRVGLARALAVDPQVLLMDEPFAALDAQTRDRIGQSLLDIWAQQRKTVLFVTHSIDEAVYLSDRILVMTFRPGTVRAEIPVDLPRPRDERVRNSAEFARYRAQVWDQLAEEVTRSEEAVLQTRR
ncbi:ABC transporter ATP-binding protein [Pseudonocardia sulfidoxydans]|uniref:ABC transporter ATP-binding protein n=1 Tax=Pseudonocardia sulfidoxydans TaxID=54011 RepID=UPI002482AE5F|nr:ABC transporter ATP-binding protein [Pseudonocardia sulfidoxydans]